MLKNLNKALVLAFAVMLSAGFIWYQSGEADDEIEVAIQSIGASDDRFSQLTQLVVTDTIKVSKDSLRSIRRMMWTSKSSMFSPPKTVYIWDSVIRSSTDTMLLDKMDSMYFLSQ